VFAHDRTARGVVGLGYLGLTAPDVDAWRAFGVDVLGLQPATDDGALTFRADDRAWRIRVEEGAGGLAYVGWEVAGAAALERAVLGLAEAGVATERAPDLAASRHVTDLIRCHDPVGNVVELFYGPQLTRDPFVSPRGVRFVMGGLGLGHIVLANDVIGPMEDFYRGTLGFQVSDTIRIGPISLVFLHVNPRHHSLALAAIPGDSGSLSHLMLEVDDIDHVGRALDLVNGGAAGLTRTLGKHSNDHMISFYVRSPSGFDVEYGWNGLTIDDSSWTVAAHDAPSLWGHRNVGTAGGG
jgi:2,3-dihydroxybiphenyl 1,2-dioxygenase